MDQPCFLITVDTKGDNAWTRPRVVTTKNVHYLERFQDLCESNGLKPTYLTNYAMVKCPVFRGFAGWVLARRVGEIGMQLHPWHTPPLVPLTPADHRFLPYLIQYPETVMRDKIRTLTRELEQVFGVKMISHRAGRWSFDKRYARLLIEEGYRVDCSVTPLVSWEKAKGDPVQGGGTNYEAFPHGAYWVDLEDISRPGTSQLLEVPMTILPGERTEARSLSEALRQLPGPLPKLTAAAERLRPCAPPVRWLQPNGETACSCSRSSKRSWRKAARTPSSRFIRQSSCRGSPAFRTEADSERLFSNLSVLFSAVRGRFRGVTLAEFHAEMASRQPAELAAT